MVVARLSPTVNQFHVVEETAQEVLAALAAGLGRPKSRAVANEAINVRGVSAAKQGERSVFYLAFDSESDADAAREALTSALNR
jgi:hypothetical protein